MWRILLTFTARQRSCGKVMFSLAFVCLQGRGGPHVTITHDALDLTVQPTHPPAYDISWPFLETCSNLFTWGLLHQYWHLVAKADMAGKRTIRILLECSLVWNINYRPQGEGNVFTSVCLFKGWKGISGPRFLPGHLSHVLLGLGYPFPGTRSILGVGYPWYQIPVKKG